MPAEITIVVKDYAELTPLVVGDVTATGLIIHVDRDTYGAIDRTLNDSSVEIGETSISRHVARLASGDRRWIGIPSLVCQSFGHRCFYVPRGSSLSSFQDLVGRRIGTDNWMASGNTWCRAAMREQGISQDQVEWVCGPVQGALQNRSQGNIPSNASLAPDGTNLLGLLGEGSLDGLMIGYPPPGFGGPDSPIVRLFPNFREVEAAYFERTRIWPAHHILVIRRDIFESMPQVATNVHDAVERSRVAWYEARYHNAESPWMLDELEQSRAIIGRDWFRPSKATVAHLMTAFTHEAYVQGLIPTPLGPEEIFREFYAGSTEMDATGVGVPDQRSTRAE